jgi:3-hydroxybutyryl-CoA dehydrogenase
MGSGIAEVAARSGLHVVMYDIHEKSVEHGLNAIIQYLNKGIEKGHLDAAEKTAALERIKPSTDLSDLRAMDFIVEAVAGRTSSFRSFMIWIASANRRHVDTNTFSIPIGRVRARPSPGQGDRIHFMNPCRAWKLVEVIRALLRRKRPFESPERSLSVLEKLRGNTHFPGFIANRILMPAINRQSSLCIMASAHRSHRYGNAVGREPPRRAAGSVDHRSHTPPGNP